MSHLDSVQVAALNFARGKRGVGWFMEQGLGKTLTALTEFRWLSSKRGDIIRAEPAIWNEHDGYADRMIVVCPNTFKQGWVDEIEKHGLQIESTIYESSKKRIFERMANMELHRPRILIINYDAIRMPEVLKQVCAWAKKGKTYLVIDESIQIKGHEAKQTKAVHHLTQFCAFVRLLTGRPQTQGPHDLWGQLRAIGLYEKTNFYAFRGTFCIMGGTLVDNRGRPSKSGHPTQVTGSQNEELLAFMMKDKVFVAKKKDWLPDLPRKDSTIRDYEMSGDQKRQYRQMEDSFLLYLANEKAITVDVAIAKFEKLAQIQTGFIYDQESVVHQLVTPASNPRVQLLLQILDEEVEGKVCVVYRHRPVLPLLQLALAKYNPTFISGGMKPESVEENKRLFNEDPNTRVILLQAEASKYGHTLLGGPGPDDLCRTMLFFENSYSADTRDQIEDRIHRRGQTGERVLYIDLSGSSLDRQIVKALQLKQDIYTSVFKHLRNAEPVREDAA